MAVGICPGLAGGGDGVWGRSEGFQGADGRQMVGSVMLGLSVPICQWGLTVSLGSNPSSATASCVTLGK